MKNKKKSVTDPNRDLDFIEDELRQLEGLPPLKHKTVPKKEFVKEKKFRKIKPKKIKFSESKLESVEKIPKKIKPKIKKELAKERIKKDDLKIEKKESVLEKEKLTFPKFEESSDVEIPDEELLLDENKGVNEETRGFVKKVSKEEIKSELKKKETKQESKENEVRQKLPKEEKEEIKQETEKTEEPKVTDLSKSLKIYKTPFDEIVSLVEKQKQVPISNILERYNIKKDVANEWGEVLSENKLIDYHIPAFGEPEFRKIGLKLKEIKKQKLSKKISKKAIITTIIVLSVIILLISSYFIFFKSDQQDSVPIADAKQEKTEERKDVVEKMDVGDIITTETAFSGNGNFECRNKEGTIRYFVSDTLLKIESLDGSAKVIVKGNETFTLNVETKNWKLSETKEDVPVPGSGTLPKIELDCKKAQINATEFNT